MARPNYTRQRRFYKRTPLRQAQGKAPAAPRFRKHYAAIYLATQFGQDLGRSPDAEVIRDAVRHLPQGEALVDRAGEINHPGAVVIVQIQAAHEPGDVVVILARCRRSSLWRIARTLTGPGRRGRWRQGPGTGVGLFQKNNYPKGPMIEIIV